MTSARKIYIFEGSAKEWCLGCVILVYRPPLAARARFTQPRDHSLADPCIMLTSYMEASLTFEPNEVHNHHQSRIH